MAIKVTIKDNGYRAEGVQGTIRAFERAAVQLFPGCTIQHFYYGNGLSMTDLVLGPGRYAHFNIAADRGRHRGDRQIHTHRPAPDLQPGHLAYDPIARLAQGEGATVKGFIKHYELAGRGMDNVLQDLHFHTHYGDHYMKSVAIRLRTGLENLIEEPPRSEIS